MYRGTVGEKDPYALFLEQSRSLWLKRSLRNPNGDWVLRLERRLLRAKRGWQRIFLRIKALEANISNVATVGMYESFLADLCIRLLHGSSARLAASIRLCLQPCAFSESHHWDSICAVFAGMKTLGISSFSSRKWRAKRARKPVSYPSRSKCSSIYIHGLSRHRPLYDPHHTWVCSRLRPPHVKVSSPYI